jgi:DNA-binding MarR family transcriptional regulator
VPTNTTDATPIGADAPRDVDRAGSDLSVDPDDIGALATRLRVEIGRLKRQVRQHGRGDLTPSQVSALASVDRFGPVRLGELARIEAVAPPTLTKIVAGLEERAFLLRREDPNDRRSALVELTRRGRRALEGVRNERNAFLAQRVATLSHDERVALVHAIELLTRLAEPDPDTDRLEGR